MKTPEEMQERIDRILHKNREHIHGVQVQLTPLEQLLQAEGGGDEEDEQIRQEARLDAFRAFMDFIFQRGPDPLSVLRHLFAVAKAVRPELIGDMSLEDISIICADGGRATVSARIQRIYNGTLAKAGMAEVRAPFQKAGDYSTPQVGNQNRTKRTVRMRAKVGKKKH